MRPRFVPAPPVEPSQWDKALCADLWICPAEVSENARRQPSLRHWTTKWPFFFFIRGFQKHYFVSQNVYGCITICTNVSQSFHRPGHWRCNGRPTMFFFFFFTSSGVELLSTLRIMKTCFFPWKHMKTLKCWYQHVLHFFCIQPIIFKTKWVGFFFFSSATAVGYNWIVPAGFVTLKQNEDRKLIYIIPGNSKCTKVSAVSENGNSPAFRLRKRLSADLGFSRNISAELVLEIFGLFLRVLPFLDQVTWRLWCLFRHAPPLSLFASTWKLVVSRCEPLESFPKAFWLRACNLDSCFTGNGAESGVFVEGCRRALKAHQIILAE